MIPIKSSLEAGEENMVEDLTTVEMQLAKMSRNNHKFMMRRIDIGQLQANQPQLDEESQVTNNSNNLCHIVSNGRNDIEMLSYFGQLPSLPLQLFPTSLEWTYLGVLSVLLAIVIFLVYFVLSDWTFKVKKRYASPPNVVCLVQVGRSSRSPSLSPFPLKLETYLRMAKIPYMNDHSGTMSSKGKTPWMVYNGQAVADSQFCIEFLKQELSIETDKHLTRQQKAVARALRELAEENLYWTMCYETFIKNPQILDNLLKDIYSPLKTFIFKMVVGRVIKKQLWGQGIGRHTDTEIWNIGQRDLIALSDYLDNKSFLMGDNPSEVDCSVFGMLAMIVWQMQGSRHESFIHDQLPNLVKFCERMRDLFWPDWEERCKGLSFVDDDKKLYTF